MAFQARDYQAAAVASIYTYFASKYGNPVVAMPTGTGKSVVIADFLRSVFQHYPTERIMVLTHVKELIKQNFDKLIEAWPTAPAGVYSAGLNRRDTFQKIIFAGIASVAKRAELFGRIGLVIVDEAHLVSPTDETMYRAFFDALKRVNPHLKIIGLTATPYRLGHGKITEDGIFTDLCFDITDMASFNRLLAEGYLCPLVPRSTATKLDTDGVHMRGGEFAANELQAAVDKSEVTYAALSEAIELGADRHHWLVFCAGVDHAIHAADMLNEMGVTAIAIHSKMSDAERDQGIRDWKAGKYRAAVNNNVLTTGIDFPGIDMIVMLRPTASTVMWVQMLGRGTRPVYAPGYDLGHIQGRLDAIAASDKPNCLVLDFARNTARLGPINDPVIPRKKGQKAGEAPVKLCMSCSTYNHASARACCLCGAEFPTYGPKVFGTAGVEELIKFDAPVVEVFKVDHVTYSQHNKVGKPPSMKVSYYCRLRMFQEYVSFEHPDAFSQRKARTWWQSRIPGTAVTTLVPQTTGAALELAEHLRAPTHLRVHLNKQYPEILAYCYDGTAFGANTDAPTAPPDTNVDAPPRARPAVATAPRPPSTGATWDNMDDDIPF